MTSNETNCTEFLKSALETQVIVSSGEWLIVVSDYVGSGMRPTTKCAEGGGERQDSVTNGLRQIDCHLSNDVGRLGNEQEAKHKEVQQAAAVTAVASNGKALKCQSSDRIAKTNGLTKAVALLVKGMTRERFLQNGETAGILKQLKDETSVDLTALEKKGLDRKTNHQNLMKTETKETDEVGKAVEGEEKAEARQIPMRPPPWRETCDD